MPSVQQISQWLQEFAPLSLAESWDNVGLLWGDPEAEVDRVMTCLTVTPTVAREAIEAVVGLIVSHHPILFRGAKRITADDPHNGMLWVLARAGIAIYSPHTAFDNTQGGINDGLARQLGLLEVSALRRSAGSAPFKVVVFTPETDVERVLAAAFSAGAGKIGAYDECSFAIPGQGTFFGREGSQPTVGQAGRRESVSELRLEAVCPSDRLMNVVEAIRAAHSYEAPAIDVYPLHTLAEGPGSGRIGRLAEISTLGEVAKKVSRVLGSAGLQVVGEPERRVERLAIVCGAGDDFLNDAARAGADALLTGEARFHRALEAEALGIGLIVAGHHATERPGVEDLAGLIANAFPGLSVWPSRSEHDPLRVIC